MISTEDRTPHQPHHPTNGAGASSRPNCNVTSATVTVMNSLNNLIMDGNYSSSLSPDDSPVHAANSSSDNLFPPNSSEK
ncbi:hypothetical protein Ciccas_012971 [Cichlidogyrus casuarinus]|uniref:Uncharacterized protein n=1 Tax=Cichlidogyrus casuarinus TaxID=1844966 RepID=A0ABD2PNN8_9PLAT